MEAWQSLYDRYEGLVFSIPLTIGLGRDDASDVVQNVFTHLIERLDSLQDGASVGGWLATVARREAWQMVARRRREPASDDIERQIPALLTQGVNHFDQWERVQWLQYGLRCLDERCRGLLMALYFSGDEPTYSAVADRLGMPVGSVGPSRARCLQRLRDILRD
jgi:RNA polymerase sigma factor (sigma-70 family)